VSFLIFIDTVKNICNKTLTFKFKRKRILLSEKNKNSKAIGYARATNNEYEYLEEQIKLAPCYGSTETAAMVTSLKPKEFLMGLKNVGEILPDTKVRINAKGLIEIKSARIGIEIIDSSKTENFKNKNGWWQTGDLGEINQINNSLYLNFLGRSDQAFNSGGEIVFPKVIETRLNEEKRNIYILREEYIQQFLTDIRDIMTYAESSEYIDERTAQTENIYITLP